MGLLAGVTIASGIANIAKNVYDSYKEHQNYAYQKDLQQKIFQREDSSVQRRVNDLRQAGLSPTLGAGQGASAGQAIKTEAPKAPHIDATEKMIVGLQMLQQKANISKTMAETSAIELQKQRSQWDLGIAQKVDPMKIEQLGLSIKGANLSNLSKNLDNQIRTFNISNQDLEKVRLENINAIQAQNLTNLQEDLLIKQITVEEKRHNLDYYKNMNLPTNIGFDAGTRGATWLLGGLEDLTPKTQTSQYKKNEEEFKRTGQMKDFDKMEMYRNYRK